MSLTDKVHGYVRVSSATLSAQELTDRLGLAPTRVQAIGEPTSPRSSSTFEKHAWILQLGETAAGMPFDDIETCLQSLVDVVQPAQSTFLGLSKTEEVEVILYFLGYGRNQVPPIRIRASLVARVAALGSSLTVNAYLDDYPTVTKRKVSVVASVWVAEVEVSPFESREASRASTVDEGASGARMPSCLAEDRSMTDHIDALVKIAAPIVAGHRQRRMASQVEVSVQFLAQFLPDLTLSKEAVWALAEVSASITLVLQLEYT